jgi:hypothetical protein
MSGDEDSVAGCSGRSLKGQAPEKDFHPQQNHHHKFQHSQIPQDNFWDPVTLVVVMNAVETWKASQVTCGERTSQSNFQWAIV